MKIEVLGCHGSETPSANTVGFLIEETLLLEAGTASSVLSMERQRKVKSVVISHLHLDHVKSLPFLADNRIDEEGASIRVYGTAEVIEGLKVHFFNNSIWPDFTRIINGGNPLVDFRTVVPGQSTMIGGIEVLPIAVKHAIPSVGFLIRHEGRSLLYTGDTAPTDEIWEVAARTTDLAGVLIETSFPDRMQEIATLSGHMTPSALAGELGKLGRPDVPVYIFHMKPRYEKTILEELARLVGNRVQVLREGQVIRL